MNGNNIVFALSGVFGLLLIILFCFELTSWMVTRMSFFHKILLYFRFRGKIKSILPIHWDINKIGFVTIHKRGFDNGYEVHISIKSKVSGDIVNDYVITDGYGNIKQYDIINRIKKHDVTISDIDLKIKQIKRESILDKMGI